MIGRKALVAVAVQALLAVTACGGGSAQELKLGNQSFPAKTFANLSGQVVWWDNAGGPTIKAYQDTIFANFAKLTGVNVVPDFYCCDLAKLQAQIQSGNVIWDALAVPSATYFFQGSGQGLFQKLDRSIVPLDKLEPGTYTDFGFKGTSYQAVVVWNTNSFPLSGKHPTQLQDIYDTANFPGKRCLIKLPDIAGNFEAALLADGVSRTSLYPLDINRAFRKMDTIKSSIVWSTGGQAIVQNLINGECTIGVTWSGRAYDAAVNGRAPIGAALGNAVIYSGWRAIAKGAPNARNAQALLAMWILDQEGQINRVNKDLSPCPIKGLTPDKYAPAVRPYLPDFSSGIQANEEYYANNIDSIRSQFNSWVAR
jgi:putative spermidine/putrescine transport system substrate-binding protein